MVIVTAIDIGYTNLAVVSGECDWEEKEIVTIKHCSLNNLRKYSCKYDNCIFDKKDNSSSHRIYHFFQSEISRVFDVSDFIIMERQPMVGLTGIEQSLYLLLKQKYGKTKYIKLISPNTLHKYFGMHSERTVRKQQSIAKTEEYLIQQPAYQKSKKKDDLADACMYLKMFCETTLYQEMMKKQPNKFLKQFGYKK